MNLKFEPVKYTAFIKNNETGQIAEYHDDIRPWENDGGFGALEFMYGLGNYSCDCNRELFFCYALNIPEPTDENNKCSNNRFSCKIILDADSTVVLNEFGPEEMNGAHSSC